jgi:hypothetical protein
MVVREVATVVDPPAAPSAPVVVAALPAAVPPPPAVPVPAARAEPSLADIAGSIAIPEAELATTRDALDIADLEQLRSEKRKAEAAEAAEAQRAAAAAKAKADADAKAKEAADVKRKHPARSWVQVATGANASALGGDFGRLARKYPDQFKGQSGGTAEWGRTRRLLVGPFKDAKAAQSWLNAYKKAGGDGFTWSSEAGQEVDKIGGR